MVSRHETSWRKRWTQIWGGMISWMANQPWIKASSLLLLSYGIVTLLGLVRTPLVVWIIPKEQVGMLGVVSSWMPFLQLVSLSGLDTASYHYTSKGQPWSFAVNLKHRLRWSLWSAAGFLGVAFYYLAMGEYSLAWLLLIAGFSFPFTTGLSAVSGMLGAQERYKALFWYRILESLTDFSGFIPLLFSAIWVSQIVTFYAANQFATLVMMIGYAVWLLTPLVQDRQNRLSQQEQDELLRYGKHQTALNGLSVLNNRVDALLVSLFLPFSTMADYSIGLLILEQLKRLWNIYLTIKYPKLVRIPLPGRWNQFIREGFYVFLSFLVAGGIIAMAAFWLIPILLPAAYSGSILLVWLMCISFIVNIPAAIAETYFRTQQDQKHQYYLRLSGIITGISFSLLLLPKWGVYGVAGGKILSAAAQSMIGSLLFFRNHHHPDRPR
jgi:O-antigen/teichoic acid export membrane protein